MIEKIIDLLRTIGRRNFVELPLMTHRLSASLQRAHMLSGLGIVLLMTMSPSAIAQSTAAGSDLAKTRITQPIDSAQVTTLAGNVRKDLTAERDMGAVEDSMEMHLSLILKRSPEQQADLDNLIARQQQPGAAEYHKWLTPREFGERFGASVQDISKMSTWLESKGMHVTGVLNNASFILFTASAAQIRTNFHTQLHYYNLRGGRYPANAQDPAIPTALVRVVSGIHGLSRIPTPSKHTPLHSFSLDTQSHRFHDLGTVDSSESEPKFTDGQGDYLLTPRDFYTVYDANKVYSTGNLGASATIGLPEPTDMHYGTVNSTTGQATGGDVVTFRTTFGIAGTLNMKVMHGAGSVTCNDPGIDAGSEGEANLDAEWSNAVAPSAQLIFMSCDDSNSTFGDGFTTALAALIDNNISDVISSSYGESEALLTSAQFSLDDEFAEQAAAQGQSFIDAAGDAGSADEDQNTSTTAIYGFNVDQYAGQPLITAVGGTDFSDKYDADQGGPPQSTYWSGTNSQYFNDALSYIPETPWNSSCADSIIAKDNGNYTGAGYCAAQGSGANGTLSGGGGGFSSHYTQPSYQTGIPGLSSAATNRAVPDISFFAAAGFWNHYLVVCDSSSSSTACSSTNTTFGGAGGTSFTAPQTAGITALLVTLTGERQGTLNPGLYALAKSQYTAPATATACYSNGQTNNIGVTTGLPAASCTFHDITTGNNDEPCQSGSLDCYVNPEAQYGILSTAGASSLTVGFPAAPEYDEATGLGSLDIYNFITNWKQAFTSSTALSASPTSISPAQSTTLKASVTSGTPAGYTTTPPALAGSVDFQAGTTALGKCTLSSGTCSVSVSGSALQSGINSITATYLGNGTYPTSTSSVVTVNVTGTAGGGSPQLVSLSPTSGSGLTQTFSAVYSDSAGSSDLTAVRLLINSSITGVDACYVYYEPASNALFLENDEDNGTVGPLTPGASSSISNGQCTLSGTGTSVTTTSTNLTVNFALTFSSTFTGSKKTYLAANTASASKYWVQEGTWTP